MAIVALVTKPTAEQEVRDSIVRLLRKTLEEAEGGEISSIAMIIGNADGEWTNRVSETVCFSEAIGRLEITKHEWIMQYLQEPR